MSILVKPTPAPKPRSKEAQTMALVLAVIFVIFAVTQLFTFEEFIKLIPMFQLPFNEGLTYALAPTLVAAEVFAIPFLLGMSLSRAFRWLSMFCGWLVAGLWLFMSFWVVSVAPFGVKTIGFLGTVASLTPGWWAVCLSIALCFLVAWTSWGLWPGKRHEK